jgi:hypothetical protein
MSQGGVLWELLHGVAKTSLLGKAKRPPAHPCNVSIAIGPQVLPPPPHPAHNRQSAELQLCHRLQHAACL